MAVNPWDALPLASPPPAAPAAPKAKASGAWDALPLAPLGALDTALAIGGQIVDAVAYEAPAAAAAMLEGDQPFAEDDYKDALIRRAERSRAPHGPERGTAIPGVDVNAIKSLGPSLGFSAVGMGAGAAGGIAAAPTAPLTFGAGPVVAGGAASFAAAQRMSENSFVRELHKAANEQSLADTGKPISKKDFAVKQAALAKEIKAYGLWEAVPEAAGNVIGFGILKAPIAGAVGRLFGKNVLTRFAAKTGAVMGSELATETPTQMGQQRAESRAGLTKEAPREFTSPADWETSFKEVAPTTVLQTAILAGGAKGAMALNRKRANGVGDDNQVPLTDEQRQAAEAVLQPDVGASGPIERTAAAAPPGETATPAPEAQGVTTTETQPPVGLDLSTNADQAQATPESIPPQASEGLVMRGDGTPFKTEKAARTAMTNRRLSGHEVVPVGEGFALRPATQAVTQANAEAVRVDQGQPAGPVDEGVEIQRDIQPQAGAETGDGQAQGAETPEVAVDQNLADEQADLSTQMLDPDAVEADAERFQFKRGGDTEGVTTQLKGTRRWDDMASGVAVVWEDTQGRRFIVDGHQRLALAKRLKAEGQNPLVRAIVLREADGITPQEARFKGALKNLQEGGESTSPVDVARVIREGGNLKDVADVIPPNRTAYRDGLELAKLSDDAFGAVLNELIQPSFAAEVARRITDPAEQNGAIQALIRAEPENMAQARQMVDQIVQAGFDKSQGEQGGLFGAEQVADTLLKERAKVLDSALRRLRGMKQVFGAAVRGEADLTGAGNTLNTQANQKAEAANARLAETITREANTTGAISTALTEAARAIRGGKSVAEATRGFLDAVGRTTAPVGGVRQEDRQDGGGNQEPVERDSDQVREAAGEDLYQRGAGEWNVQSPAPIRNQLDLFAPKGKPAPTVGKELSRRVKRVVTGTFPAPEGPVKTAEQAASFIAPLRKEPQESVIVVVTNDVGDVLATIRHTIGETAASAVEAPILMGAIHNVEGATRAWFVHQHPSGNLVPSDGDKKVTVLLAKALQGTGVELQGSLIVAPGKKDFATVPMEEDGGSARIPVPPVRRTRQAPVSGRRWQKIGAGLGEAITSPNMAREAIAAIAGGREGVVLMDRAHVPVGFLPMSAEQMAELRTGKQGTGASALLQAMEETNASTLIVALNSENAKAAENIRAFTDNTQGRVLDFITPAGRIDPNLTRLYYRSAGEAATASTPTGIRTALEGAFGKRLVRNLLGQGWLEVVATKADLPFNVDGTVRGVYDPKTGKSWLVADALTSADAPAVLLHEVGVHHGLSGLMAPKRWAAAVSTFKALEAAKNKAALAARDRAKRAGSTGALQDEEAIAYLVEAQAQQPTGLVKRIKSAVGARMFSLGMKRALSADEFVSLAKGAAKKVAASRNPNRPVLFSQDDFALETYDTQDLEARERRAKEAEKAEAERRKRADAPPPTEFELTGSDLPADANPRQQRLFSRAPAIASAAFRKWFGKSVVTVDGKPGSKPLVVYHGTRGDFSQFDPLRAGTASDAGWYGAGFYFTPDPMAASTYAANRDSDGFGFERMREGSDNAGANVIPAYLSLQNPYDWRSENTRGLFQNNLEASVRKRAELEALGHDGVLVFRDFIQIPDGGSLSDEQWAALSAASPMVNDLGRDAVTDLFKAREWTYRELEQAYGADVAQAMLASRSRRILMEAVAFRPEQIKSAIGNRGTFDPANPDIRFSRGQPNDNDLIIQHNLTVDNLLHADRMGGLPVPSLAVTRASHPLTNFGEITLIGDRDLADPKRGTKVFGADIYSPRYPNIHYKIDARGQKTLSDKLAPFSSKVGLGYFDLDSLQKDGADYLITDARVIAAFLDSKGIKFKTVRNKVEPLPAALKAFARDTRHEHEIAADPAFIEAAYKANEDLLAQVNGEDFRSRAKQDTADQRASVEKGGTNYVARRFARDVYRHQREVREAGTVDRASTRMGMQETIRKRRLSPALKSYANDLLASLNPTEHLFKGFTRSGNRSYIPHTLDNVIAALKKEMVGGEGFNYGVASIRARFTPQFKSVEQIRAGKGRLKTKAEFESVKDEIDREFWSLTDKLASHHPGDMSRVGDALSEMMADAAKMGVPRALKNNLFTSVPVEKQELIAGFLAKLRDVPTEYFEAKIPRAVGLSEFRTAVVPKGLDPKARQVLERAGLKIVEYKKGDGSREQAIAKASRDEGLLFSRGQPDKYPMAGPVVDGREVRDDVPNMSSISASLDDYTVLRGVREVPMSDFTLTGKSYSASETKRIEDLADRISESGEINPLIVVIDKDGPYILEGGHRAEALFRLGAQSFPAVVVVDNESLDADTIMVDGVNRPTRDSDGRPIHPTEEGLRNFWRWFTESVVVDSGGRPKPVYHGARTDFAEFDSSFMYSGEGASQSGSGFYFTTNPESASGYAGGEGGRVMPVYLAIKNPLKIDFASGEVSGADITLTPAMVRKIILSIPGIRSTEDSPLLNFGDIEYEGFEKVLREAVRLYAGGNNIAALRNDFFGKDNGAWLKAFSEATGYDSAYSVTSTGDTHYVAWFPTQIKSIYNSGAYGLDDPRLSYARQAAPTAGRPVAEVTADIEARLGGKLPDGFVVAADTAALREDMDRRGSKHADKVDDTTKGLYDPSTETSYVVVGNLTAADSPWGLFLHEAGEHYGLKRMLGEEAHQQVLRQAETLVRARVKPMLAAARRVNAAEEVGLDPADKAFAKQFADKMRADPHLAREVIAYLAENPANHNMPLMRRIIAAVRAFMRKLGMAKNLTTDDIVAMVIAAARRSGEFSRRSANAGETATDAFDASAQYGYAAMRSERAAAWYSQLTRTLANKLPAKGPAAQMKQAIEAFQKKGEFKAEELEFSGILPWLDAQEGTVTRDEILDVLAQNAIEVREVTHTSPPDLEWVMTKHPDYYTYYESAYKRSDGRTGTVAVGRSYDDSWDTFADGEIILKDGNWISSREAASFYVSNPVGAEPGGRAKFGKYQLPGGTNYREVLLTLPMDAQTQSDYENGLIPKSDLLSKQYFSSHFPETPNIVAHVRLNDRVDAQGRKVLFMEEFQSDYSIAIRKSAEVRAEEEGLKKGTDEFKARVTELAKDPKALGMPGLPFGSSWPMLAMKRVLRMAVEGGYDAVAWTPGEVQAERYDLSKQVDSVTARAMDGGKFVIYANKGGEQVFQKIVTRDEMPGLIGKDLSTRILNDYGNHSFGLGDFNRKYSGLDLKIGGTWAVNLYDKQIPNELNKYVKRWHARTGQFYLSPNRETRQLSNDSAANAVAIGAAPVHAVEITDAMREGISDGQPLFSRVRGTAAQEAVLEDTMGPAPGEKRFGNFLASIAEKIGDINATSIRQGLFDSFSSIAAYERDANSGKVMDAATSAWKMALTTRNLSSVITAMMVRGPIELVNGEFALMDGRKGLIDIFRPLADKGLLRLWEGWAAANRAQRLMTEGREHNFTQAQISTLLDLERQYPEFRTALDEYQEFNKAVLDMAEAAGVIDPVARATWARNDYVPFYRIIEDAQEAVGPHGSRGIAKQRSGIRTLVGGEERIGSVLENIVMNMAHLVDATYKNEAMRRTVGLTNGIGMNPIGQDWKPVSLPDSVLKKALEAHGVQVGTMTPAQKSEWSRVFSRIAPQGPDVVWVLKDGKPEYYRVTDPLLLRSVLSFGPQATGAWMTALKVAKTTLTKGVTVTPEFMAANFVRDTMATWVISDRALVPVWSAAKGFVKALTGSGQAMHDMMTMSGLAHGFYDVEPRNIRHSMEEKAHLRPVGIVRTLWRAWQRIGFAFEQANRVAIYEATIKKGGSRSEAAHQARDILDFSMRGDWAAIQFLADAVPFFNARLQGLYKLGRGAAEHPLGFFIKGSLLTAATLALMAGNDDDDRYGALPEWEKDLYWHFWIDDEHFRIPKPFEVGVLFATIPERFSRMVSGKDSGRTTMDAAARVLGDVFALNPIPQLLKPASEQVMNYNTFMGRPIVSRRLERLPPEMQYDPWTSESLRALSEVMPGPAALRSPKRLEHLLRGYFGSVAMYLVGISDRMVRAVGDYPDEPEGRLTDVPLVGRFYRGAEPGRTRYGDVFYDMLDEAEAAASTVRELRNQGLKDEANEVKDSKRDLLRARLVLSRKARQLSQLRKQERAIYYSRTLTPAQKRAKLDDLKVKADGIYRNMVERYERQLR